MNLVKVSFISILLSLMARNGEATEYSFHGEDFDFDTWSRSKEELLCPHDQQYVIVCKLRWDNLIQELHACRAPGIQCANGTVVTSTCINAIGALVIGALLFYACRMRKKVIRNNRILMARASGEQNTRLGDKVH